MAHATDIAGSIRVPAAYCGLYGHRPSETAVPRVGSFPFADAPNPGAAMGVQGPLARTAVDLELLFDVIIGPVAGEDVAWRLDLPASRHERLADFRVAVLPPLDVVQPGLPPELSSLVSRALLKDPEQRFQRAEMMHDVLAGVRRYVEAAEPATVSVSGALLRELIPSMTKDRASPPSIEARSPY